MPSSSKQKAKVLPVNPGDRAAVYQGVGDTPSAVEPASLAGLIATYLRGHGLPVDFGDASDSRKVSPECPEGGQA